MKGKMDPSKAFRIPSLEELPPRETPLRPTTPPLPEFTPTGEGALPALDPKATPAPPPERGPLSLQGELKRTRDQLEKLKVKLAQAEKARAEAVKERDKALQERAALRKQVEALTASHAAMRQALEKAQEDLKILQEELETLKKEKGELETLRKERDEYFARAARWEKAETLRERLQEPFPLEAFFRMLFVPYSELGPGPEARLLALIEGYRALLQGKEHPMLSRTNRELLSGEPEGIVLLGVERLLLDLAESPLPRWLKTHAWLAESFLTREKLSSPREEA